MLLLGVSIVFETAYPADAAVYVKTNYTLDSGRTALQPEDVTLSRPCSTTTVQAGLPLHCGKL